MSIDSRVAISATSDGIWNSNFAHPWKSSCTIQVDRCDKKSFQAVADGPPVNGGLGKRIERGDSTAAGRRRCRCLKGKVRYAASKHRSDCTTWYGTRCHLRSEHKERDEEDHHHYRTEVAGGGGAGHVVVISIWVVVVDWRCCVLSWVFGVYIGNWYHCSTLALIRFGSQRTLKDVRRRMSNHSLLEWKTFVSVLFGFPLIRQLIC